MKPLFVLAMSVLHAPDTSLNDISLIKMICSSSVINQAKQNDKWKIILRKKSQNSSPAEGTTFPKI